MSLRVVPASSRQDLTFPHALRQIRLVVPIDAAPSTCGLPQMDGWIELVARYPTSHEALPGPKITSQEVYHKEAVGTTKRKPEASVMKSNLWTRDTCVSLEPFSVPASKAANPR